jgi:hypothetical protein
MTQASFTGSLSFFVAKTMHDGSTTSAAGAENQAFAEKLKGRAPVPQSKYALVSEGLKEQGPSAERRV